MLDKLQNFINEQLENHKYRTIFGFLGFLLASFILIIGFFNTLFILILLGIGATIGKKIDNDDTDGFFYLLEKIQKFIPPYRR